MSLRVRVAGLLAAVVAVTVACSSLVAIWALEWRAEELDRENARALERVSEALARRAGIPLPEDELLPGVLRPSTAAERGSEGAELAIVAGGVGGGAIAIGLGLLLVSRLRRPLDDLRTGTQAVAAGRFGHRVPASGPPELRELAVAFNGMAAAIERSDEQHRAWLDDLAHELRTPVAVIQAYSEALADGLVAEGVDRAAAQRAVAANAARCGELLDAMRSELAGEAGDRATTDVDELVDGTLVRFSQVAGERGVELTCTDRSGGAAAQGGPVALGRVLDNLVENALRAAASDGHVAVVAAADARTVTIRVDDDGPGVPPEDRLRAFDRFWRGDPARAAGDGRGLGLAISRDLVTRAGGTIAIGDAPLGGARLEVRLPRERTT